MRDHPGHDDDTDMTEAEFDALYEQGGPVDVVIDPDFDVRTYTWREALSGWWSTDPVLAVDEALHCLPWRLHALLFSWWLCDLADVRLGMTWKQVRQQKRIPSWRGALRHWR